VGTLIELTWINRIRRSGWRSEEPKRKYLFDHISLQEVPRHLRRPHAPNELRQKFFQLFSNSDFLAWWNQSTGGSGRKHDKYLRLSFPSTNNPFAVSGWDIPWELLVESLKATENHMTVAMVRSIGQEVLPRNTNFREKMRVLMLQGDDGRRFNRPLNLKAEAEMVSRAWKDLPVAISNCIDEPLLLETSRKDLQAQIESIAPHIVWFSGHGRAEPKSGLLFGGGRWVEPKEFASLLAPSGDKLKAPIIVIFWACDTGREEPREESIPVSPPLFEALSKIGVSSVLAMQSPIRDKSAKAAAGRLFHFLASGFPLEYAAARVRAILMDEQPGHELDWASLVVWSTCESAGMLKWSSEVEQSQAQFQLLGSEALRWQRSTGGELEAPSSAEELATALQWSQLSRLWVSASYEDGEIQHLWVRILRAIQLQTTAFVLAVDLHGVDVAEGLRNWAEILLSNIPTGNFPEVAVKALSQITRNQTAGWRSLCAIPNLHLAVAKPPEYSENEWFWEPMLEEREDLRVLVLVTSKNVPDHIYQKWNLDSLGSAISEQSVVTAVARAPRLARALATLNLPLDHYLLRIQTDQAEVESLDQWPEYKHVMLETTVGPVMTATARRYVLNLTNDPALLRQAHFDCVKMLDQPSVQLRPAIREKLIEHLLGAELNETALVQATYLTTFYREQDRPSAVLQLKEKLGENWRDLPEEAGLVLAWAYLYLGQPKKAEFLLDKIHPPPGLDKAWKHGMMAEIYKSTGDLFSREKAFAEIEAAIEECQKAVPANSPLVPRRRRAYRQDRARILQFLFNDREGKTRAAKEYQTLILEWTGQPEATLDLAIVKRNYSECLRVLADPSDKASLAKARNVLTEAELLARHYSHVPILAEILYEKAKFPEVAVNCEEVRKALREANDAAIESRHYMLLAIIESRLFWKCEQFTAEKWAQIRMELEEFPHHGWAVRVLVDGNLRAARKLEGQGRLAEAFAELEIARDALKRNSAFDQGSDRVRIAETAAGLDLIGAQLGQDGSNWLDFIEKTAWARDWLAQIGNTSAEAIWKEGH
jgi:hypothetical protein